MANQEVFPRFQTVGTVIFAGNLLKIHGLVETPSFYDQTEIWPIKQIIRPIMANQEVFPRFQKVGTEIFAGNLLKVHTLVKIRGFYRIQEARQLYSVQLRPIIGQLLPITDDTYGWSLICARISKVDTLASILVPKLYFYYQHEAQEAR